MFIAMAFLFAAILWALPLASIPVLLHLLFHRKSQVVHFSTLRFVRQSLRQTAVRRRIQKWLLLACRVLLLALLIWAAAQPVKMMASGWFAGEPNTLAAIVIDTSYSMQLRQGQMTLLDSTNDIVTSLLRGPLAGGEVAIFRPGRAEETLEPASQVLAEWSNVVAGPSPNPLSVLAEKATAFLDGQQAGRKWLVVISDLQSR
jgi:hypothetical protein